MINRRATITAITGIGVAALASGCLSAGNTDNANSDGSAATGPGKKTVEVMYGLGPDTEPGFKADVSKWAAANGITVKFTKAAAWDTEIRTRVQGGNPPDVGMFPQPGLMCDLAKQGKLVAFDSATVATNKETLVPGIVEAGTCADGKVYGLPNEVSVKSAAKVWEALHISALFERAGEFDVIHNSFDFLPLTYSDLVDTPVVTTIHGFSSEQIVPVFEKYNASGYYVAISDSDRHERLDYVATIHHGIDMDEFERGEGPGDYLLFFGRIHPEKGTVEAIDVAQKAGLPLIIAGIVQDHEYFERCIEPRLDGSRVTYAGPVGPDRRGALLAGARALLHLVSFDEPFGFSVVEAMACGTPVIAHPRGSMPEIVRDGVNGFLVGSLEEAVVGVRAAASMDRTLVRASVERRFDSNRMVDDYLELYHRVAALDRARRAGNVG